MCVGGEIRGRRKENTLSKHTTIPLRQTFTKREKEKEREREGKRERERERVGIETPETDTTKKSYENISEKYFSSLIIKIK